jgi:hypothetical protein
MQVCRRCKQLAALLATQRPELLDENQRRRLPRLTIEGAVLAHFLPCVRGRLWAAPSFRGACMTPFVSSHVRSARRICSENGTPSRSRSEVIASNVSLSGRKVITRSLAGMCNYCNTTTTSKTMPCFPSRRRGDYSQTPDALAVACRSVVGQCGSFRTVRIATPTMLPGTRTVFTA